MSTVLGDDAIRQLAEACAVYRMFDKDGQLLYIGKTGRAGARFGEHSSKRWFPLVTSITLEWYDSEADAAAAESLAIRAERPRYNKQGLDTLRGLNPPKRKPWQPVPRVDLPAPDVTIPDVLSIFFGRERHLYWQTVAERVTDRYPRRWAGATGNLVSAHMRRLGVPSVSLREAGGRVRRGCRRVDVEAAAAALPEARATH